MRHRLLALCLALAAAAACDDPSGVKVGPPASLEVVAGNNQQGAAGTELPDPLVVKVTDERGHAVKGQLVNFRVTAGGGTVFASASITNNDGIAQERWTLGTQAGSTQTVEARAIDSDTGAPLVFATFTATVTASTPTQVRAAPAAGDTLRVGIAGSQATDSLRVLVRDQYGNPVPGASVQWTASTGGGAIGPAGTIQTGADGIARAAWVLGNTTGVTQNAEAFVAGAGTVRFVARVATTMTRFAGDGQTAAVGSPITVSVRLTDSAGQGVGGIPVTWQVMSGGGSVAATSASGGLDGVASVQWTLGMTPGVQVLNATAGTLNLAFTANAQPSATRTLVTQVPGTVLDVDGTRVLWMDGTALKVRSRSGGGDVTILADSSASGRLFPGGVIAVRGTNPYTVYQYVSGTPTAIGTAANGNPHDVDETYAVQGSWAAWRQHPTGPVLRRNLATGAVDTVAQANVNARRGSLDVGPNGNVAYDHVFGSSGGGGTTAGYMWTPSFSDLFYNAFTYGTLHLKTDGNNVIFTTMDTQGAIHLRLANPGSSYILSSAPGGSFAGPQPEGRVAGGWVAYLYRETNMGQWVAEVRLRSPTFSGAPPLYSERVSPAGGLAGLDALSPDGTVAWRIGQVVSGSAAYTRRYISPRNAPAVDAGPVESNERVIWRSGTFYLLKADGSVYAFSW